MTCVICQYGETEPGTTTVTLTRGETTVVMRDVPAQICTTCTAVFKSPFETRCRLRLRSIMNLGWGLTR